MRLLVLSDLHLEVWREYLPPIDPSLSRPDVVVLAGDIHTSYRAPAWAAQRFAGIPVLYVPGNHEFYGEVMENARQRLRDECERFTNVHYLDCDEYLLGGVRFLGATLWTDFSLFDPDRKASAMLNARLGMADYQRIRVASERNRKLHPQDTALLHAAQRDWLQGKLDESFDGKTVVITHMAPSRRSVAPRFAQDPLSPAFASNLDRMATKVDVWVHGHTHDSFDYRLGRCRVFANPLGYILRSGAAENPTFDPNFIVLL